MTLTLLLGGLLWFFLACNLAWGRAVGTGAHRLTSLLLAMLGPGIAALVIHFALAEGAMTVNAPETVGRLAGQTRLALLEVAIDRTDSGRGIAIGGDPAIDDIVVAGLPRGAVRIRSVDDAIRVELASAPGEAGRSELFVGSERVTRGGHRDVAAPTTVTVAMMSPRDPIPTEVEDLPKSRVPLTIVRQDRSWRVIFARPELKLASGANVQPASADLENQPREGDNVVAFKSLGGTFGPLLEQTELVLPQAAGLRTYVSGSAPGYQENQRVILRGAGLETVLRVDPLNLTSGLRGFAGTVAPLVLLSSLVLFWRVRRDSALAAMLLGIAEVLLTLRILIALAGGMVEESAASRSALADAMLALPMGLLALGAAIAPLRRLPLAVVALGGSTVCILVLVVAVEHSVPRASWQVVIGLALLATGAAALRQSLPWVLANLDRWRERMAAQFRRAIALFQRSSPGGPGASQLLARWQLPHWASEPWAAPILWSYGFGTLVLLARVLFALFDIEERIQIGGGSGGALSIAFVPLTLLVASPLLRQLSRSDSGAQLFTSGAAFAGFLQFFVVVPNGLAGDSGLSVVLALALALAGAGGRLVRGPPVGWRIWIGLAAMAWSFAYGLSGWLAGNGGWWMLPALLMAAGIAVLGWKPSLQSSSAILWLGPAAGLLAVMLFTAVPQLRPGMDAPPRDPETMIVNSTPMLRLMAALAPERLDFQVSTRGTEHRETISHLSYYVESTDGRRFLNLPLPPAAVKNQQFSDYVVAIHVISPFGRLAAAGLLLMLGGVAVLGFTRVAESRGVAWFGVLAILTFTVTSAYIALANALMAPFTGRNFYLLAVQSSSDLIEGLLLLVLAGVALLAPRTEVLQ